MAPGSETRAVWVEQMQDLQLAGTYDRSAVERIVDECAQLGATRLLWLIKARTANTASVLWYPSEFGPSHPSVGAYDGLADARELTREAGIELHAYFSVFPEGDAAGTDLPAGEAVLARHPEWAVVDAHGRPTTFVCAAHEGYRQYLLNLADEAIRKYDFDGIHLDFIRYPRSACYCALCTEAIQDRFGLSTADAQRLIEVPGQDDLSYDERAVRLHEADSLIDYYCDNVYATVRAVRGLLDSGYPGKKLSAAVFPSTRSAPSQVYCDWPGFAPLLDFVCPMVYWYSPAHFALSLVRTNALISPSTQLLPGISALGSAHELAGKNVNFLDRAVDYDYLTELITTSREIGTGGFAMFHHAPIFGHAPGGYTGHAWGAPLDTTGLPDFLKFLQTQPA